VNSILQWFKKKLNCFLNQFNADQSDNNQTTMAPNESNESNELFPNPANIFRNQQNQQNQPKPQDPSICIPRVFTSTTRRDLYRVIETLALGAVDRIDMVSKVNDRGEPYYKVFIHFKMWNTKDATAVATRDKLLKGEEIKIVYRDPWFWKCTASRVEKPEYRDYSAPPPRIDLGGCKSLCVANDAVVDDGSGSLEVDAGSGSLEDDAVDYQDVDDDDGIDWEQRERDDWTERIRSEARREERED